MRKLDIHCTHVWNEHIGSLSPQEVQARANGPMAVCSKALSPFGKLHHLYEN
jgi:hypothetical protein